MGHLWFGTLLILFSLNLQAAETGSTTCIKLEGVSIGCVPSTDHPCFRNVNPEASGNDGGKCIYYPEGAFLPPPDSDPYFGQTIASQYGPIAWRCQTWEAGSTCPPGGDVTTCPSSKCLVYERPVCRNTCTWCIRDTKETRSQSKGCLVCTRPYCDDEPIITGFCPLNPTNPDGTVDLTYSLPRTGMPKCPSNTPPTCDQFARPPTSGSTCDGPMNDQGECEVDIRNDDCPPRRKIEKVDNVVIPESCPWINDERTYTPPSDGPPPTPGINHCEAVREGNRFPQDCPGGPPCT